MCDIVTYIHKKSLKKWVKNQIFAQQVQISHSDNVTRTHYRQID